MRRVAALLALWLPASAFGQQLPSFKFQQGRPDSGRGGVAGKPLCEHKELVARAVLPDAHDYFASDMVLETQGMRVHVSGNKDREQNAGYYLAFQVEGVPHVKWVPASRSRQDFTLMDKNGGQHVFHAQVAIGPGLFHHEKIELTFSDDRGFKRTVTTGDLGVAVQRRMPTISLLGRKFHVTRTRDIKGEGWNVAERQTHSIVVTAWDSYRDDGKTFYKFDDLKLVFQDEQLKTLQLKPMKAKARGVKGEIPVVYGFRIAGAALEVLDMTDYSGKKLPPCD